MTAKRRKHYRYLPAMAVGVALLSSATVVQGGETERVSVASSGFQGNGDSIRSALSSTGRFVAFSSVATTLVTGDTNGAEDIFVHDRTTGVTERVSVASSGVQSNGDSFKPVLSSTGRFVAFSSAATNLVAGDTNGAEDVFVHDRITGETERVSVSSAGVQGNFDSLIPAISANGRFVAFESSSTNLVAGDTNADFDIFVHDRTTGETERVSVSSAGVQGDGGNSLIPAISATGRIVAFSSAATNLVAGDTNGVTDMFVHDRVTGVTERVSVDSAGVQSNDSSFWPALSSTGRVIAFYSDATNLVTGDTNGVRDIFVHNRVTGETERVSLNFIGGQSNGDSSIPAISANGRLVAFGSVATNLVPGDTNGVGDIFVYDRTTGNTERVSVHSTGTQGNGDSSFPAISANGRFVAFESEATNFEVVLDSNGASDIFVHDRK